MFDFKHLKTNNSKQIIGFKLNIQKHSKKKLQTLRRIFFYDNVILKY